MKHTKTIVKFTCDVCGKEFENKREFSKVCVDGPGQAVDKIYIQKYGIYKRFVMEDICWECHEKIFNFLDDLSKSFRYAYEED